ncbi:MAG TPA: AAA family ATPase [Pseudoduganella sp.]
MTPLSLTLIGFKGIRDGLGRETISINFAALTQGAELVAITGRNGRGKSTILDNMTPYAIMPSKAGSDGMGAFSYYDEVYLPESRKELIWEMQGSRYRSEVIIRDQGRRRTEAYLHAYADGRWIPVQLGDGTVSDGRMETYQRCVEGIAGNCATFLTTAFSAQNRRQLSAYRNAEIKALLADLLGLEKIRALGEQASETLRLIRAGLLTLRQSRADQESESSKLIDILACLGDVDKQADLARQNKDIAAERRDARRTELATLTAQRDLGHCHEERRAQLTQERQRAMHTHAAAQTQLNDMERSANDALQRHYQRVAARTAQRNTQIASLRAQMTCLQRTIHGGRHVERAVRRQSILKSVLRQRVAVTERWERAAARQESLRGDVAVKESQLTSLEREAGQAALAERDLRRRFGLTDEVPCKGMSMQQDCKLLADARAARPLIPDASAKIARLEQSRRVLRADLQSLQRQLRDEAIVESRLRTAKAKRCRTEARLSWELQLAARSADIAHAKARLQDLEQQLVAAETCVPNDVLSDQEEVLALQAQLDDVARRRAAQTESHRASLAGIDQVVSALPAPFDDAALSRAVSACAQAEAFLQNADKALAAAVASAQRAADVSQRLLVYETKCMELDQQIARIENEVANWTLFAKCMGNDGIVALAIDDAGPELSARANQLLLACYGPRFTVSIKTQLSTAKGDLKEGFEITVHDACRNSSKSVAKMSGGERIWINECLTRAMALYLAEASPCRSSTLFSDEADGAFDAQHKRQFMAMKREVLRIGGYRQEYFISHTPELTEMAGAVIDLDQYAVDATAAAT